MTYIKLDEAIAAVQDNLAFSVKVHIIAALRDLPTVSVTDEMVEAAMIGFTMSAAKIEKDVRLCDLTKDEVRMLVGDALNAAFSPLPSPHEKKGD